MISPSGSNAAAVPVPSSSVPMSAIAKLGAGPVGSALPTSTTTLPAARSAIATALNSAGPGGANGKPGLLICAENNCRPRVK